MKIYIASSFRNVHAVRLLSEQLRTMGHEILDWTRKATPPESSAAKRREWMDTHNAKEVFEFCSKACAMADVVIYLGASGQDAGVEIGMAYAAGIPIVGIRGPLEDTGLMLSGAVTLWLDTIFDVISFEEKLVGLA